MRASRRKIAKPRTAARGIANFDRHMKAKPETALANLDRDANPPPSAGH
jgi:hypothetical protein